MKIPGMKSKKILPEADALEIELKRLTAEKIRQEIITQQAIAGKTKHEEEKIKIEINHLKAPWFKKHQWAMLVNSLILGLFTFIVFFKQNSFQVEKATSQHKTYYLERTNDSLNGIIYNLKSVVVPGLLDSVKIYRVRTFNIPATVTPGFVSNFSATPNTVYNKSCDQICANGHFSLRGAATIEPEQANFNQIKKAFPSETYSVLVDSSIKVSDDEIALYMLNNASNKCMQAHF